MNKLFKKALSLVVAAAVTVSGAAVANSTTANAAKSASIPVSCYFAGNSNCTWLANDDGSNGAAKVSKTVKITKGKPVSVTLTIGAKGNKITEAAVFCIDTKGILKKFKKVKYSNISVKCDGKAVSGIKTAQGYFEPKAKTDSWRLSFFNKYGSDGDNTKSNGTAKKYKFKKNLVVSFTITAN